MPRIRIPREHEDAIVAAYLAGATQQQAAALFGYSGDACLNALRRRGITPRTRAEVCGIPPEHQEAIVAAYLAGATRQQAAALFGYSDKACLNALRRRGIIPRSHSEACRIPQDHEDAMINAYLAGSSTVQAAALFGHSSQTCTNILRRRGITPRSREEVCRRYAVDETYFDCIDTEEKAYWLGFLTADGGIVRGSIVLQLKAADIDHIRKFAASLRADHPIHMRDVVAFGHRWSMPRIAISSTRLVAALKRLGLHERKSGTVCPCSQVPASLAAPYWRGIVDGDGSISLSGGPTPSSAVSLVGNEAIVSGFQAFVSESVNGSRATVRPHKRIYCVKYSGKATSRAVARLLYGGATIYLDRKYVRVKRLLNIV